VLYQQLADAGYSSKELFYNLANTYFKLKKFGYAVYYYEKAKQLDPHDEDIQFNLELTQLYLKDKIITPPEFILYDISKRILYFFPTETWAILSLVSWFILVGTVLLKQLRPEPQQFFKILLAAVIFFFLFCTVNFTVNVYVRAKIKEAVILNSVSDVKSEPDNAGSILFILHEGTKVQIRSERNEWIEIRLKDGKIGWIRKDDAGAL
jgi:tetratricopeptide (TPR) repeat protein